MELLHNIKVPLVGSTNDLKGNSKNNHNLIRFNVNVDTWAADTECKSDHRPVGTETHSRWVEERWSSSLF